MFIVFEHVIAFIWLKVALVPLLFTTMASLLELARRRRAARPSPFTPVNTEPRTTPPDDGSSPPPNPQSDSDATPNPFAPSAISQVVRLKNFGERALKRIKLSDESQAEFRQYMEVMPPAPTTSFELTPHFR
jgi:hypothetical protein